VTRVSDFVTLDRPDLRPLERHKCNGLPVESDELDFERAAATMDMNNGADVARGQFLAREICRQHNSFVLDNCTHTCLGFSVTHAAM